MQGLVVKQEVDVYHASELSSLAGEKKKVSINQAVDKSAKVTPRKMWLFAEAKNGLGSSN